MRKTLAALVALVNLAATWGTAVSETSGARRIEELVKLAPRISLIQEDISTFEVKGVLDYGEVRLHFTACGQKPDQLALTVLDPRDQTPVLVGADNQVMLYDPISSDVLLLDGGSAGFTLTLEKTTDASKKGDSEDEARTLSFGFRVETSGHKQVDRHGERQPTTDIDIPSLLAAFVQPLDVKTKDGKNFVVEGQTKRGNRLVAFVTPSRKEGPYSTVELYTSGSDKPFLVLDISVNHTLPARRFAFPKEELLGSGLPIKELSDEGMIKTMLSLGRLTRAMVARLVLAGADDPTLKSAVEAVALSKLDWEKLRENDRKVAPILRALFSGSPPE